MDFIQIDIPNKPKNGNLIFGTPIPPIKRLHMMGDTEFEEIVMEWAYSYLKGKYVDVMKIGGAGDKGRDIIGYYDDGNIDIYQCKHYSLPLVPSKFWVELGKLCYYTYKNSYRIPKNYYIVASSGINEELKSMILNPASINSKLIVNWNSYCKKKITLNEIIPLDGDFKNYVSAFDFSIIKNLPEMDLVEQYKTTPWFKYRFGGGLIKKPRPEMPPSNVNEEEKKLEYFKELISVYSEHTNGNITDLDTLKSNHLLNEHFSRQRISYYCAQTLKRFSRDELLNEEIYEDAKNQVYSSVIDISLEQYEDGYKRLNETLREARRISLVNDELGCTSTDDRCGICHELVNDNKLKWVNIDEENENL